jgi:hypothetical protein
MAEFWNNLNYIEIFSYPHYVRGGVFMTTRAYRLVSIYPKGYTGIALWSGVVEKFGRVWKNRNILH